MTDQTQQGRARLDGWTPDGVTLIYAAIVVLAGVLGWLSHAHPAHLPVWAPWDFSPTVYFATTLTTLWCVRGLMLAPAEARPPAWRTVSFFAGVILTYAVLQTRFEYWSQHMFFLNRIQHVAMHHAGPVLIAIGWPWPAIRRGMPERLRHFVDGRAVSRILWLIQQPVVAAVLFVGLFWFWLIPPVHFRAMLDPRLYAIMNWSMVLDGVLFWSLVLDPRPWPSARTSYGVRVALALGVIAPQIALGALITFASFDLYPYYDLCGRLFPSITALDDQQLGGLIIWIPPSMMSLIGTVLVMHHMLRDAARKEEAMR